MLKKLFTATILTTSLLTGVTACSSTPPTSEETTTTEIKKLNPNQFTKIIDVRSLEEYNKEHLDGAIRISINEEDFEKQINSLDKKGNYYLYSRSASRPEAAIRSMKENGFTGKLVNGGEIHDASRQLGIEAVKPAESK